MNRVGLLGLVLGGFPITLAADQTEPNVQNVVYQCDRAVLLPVTVLNPTSESGVAVIHVEGKQVPLRRISTGSGARYVALDEQDSYRLYINDNTAFVTHLYADHTAQEEVILTNCEAPN